MYIYIVLQLPELAMELVYPLGGTSPKQIDFLGVYFRRSLEWLVFYESINFTQLFVGSLQVSLFFFLLLEIERTLKKVIIRFIMTFYYFGL